MSAQAPHQGMPRIVRWLQSHWTEVLIVAVGALLRLLWLDLKPAHFDEGVNGWFVDQITRDGTFRYDPENYHGPLHFYVLFLSQTLFGRSIEILRLPVVVVSTLSIVAMLRFGKFFGKPAARLAATAMAISPAFVFYGRYSIHEAWLVLFLMATLYGVLGLLKTGDRRALWTTIAGVSGMMLTKETYILHLVALAAGACCLRVYERFVPSAPADKDTRQSWSQRDLWYGVAIAVGVLVFFYSGNLRNFSGIFGMVQTFPLWFETGTDGHGHDKWFLYWIELGWTYEWPMLLGLLACLRFLWPSNRLMRFVVIYAAGVLLTYSVVSYKTPWCSISIFWPFLLVGMSVVVEYWKTPRLRPLVAGLAGIALLHSGYAMLRVNFKTFTDDGEPYVYVQTYRDLEQFTDPLLALAAEDPTIYHLRGTILADNFYPLPWQLADFTAIAWLNPPDDPMATDAAQHFADNVFLLVNEESADQVEMTLTANYFSETVRFRSAQKDCRYYLREDLFGHLFPKRSPEFVPKSLGQ